jgi:hypothetical protein
MEFWRFCKELSEMFLCSGLLHVELIDSCEEGPDVEENVFIREIRKVQFGQRRI